MISLRRTISVLCSKRPRPCLIAALAIAAASAVALADPPVTPDPAALAAIEKRLASPDLDATARADLAAEADAARAALIGAQPNDERAPTWLVDRAAYALDQAAATGLDVVCIFGLPTRLQIEQVRPIADRAADYCQRADDTASQHIAALEAQLLNRNAPPSPAAIADIESRLKKLVDTEQATRVPYLRALARTLQAASVADPKRAPPLAEDAVRDLRNLAPTSDALAVSRQAALGAALIHAASGERAAEILEAAAGQFAEAAAAANARTDPATALRIRLGLLRTGQSRPQPAADAPTATTMLEAESSAAWYIALSAQSIADRADRVAHAVRILFASMPTDRQVAAGAPDRRVLICEKIAVNTPRTIPFSALPPEAAFARAVTLARAARAPDEKTREEAANLFTHVADRDDASAPLRAAARWERAVVIGQGGSEGGDELAELDAIARVFGDDPKCEQAIPAAKRTVEAFTRRQAMGGALSEGWRTRAGSLREALALLLVRDPDDRWRFEIVRLAAEDMGAGSAVGAGGVGVAAALPGRESPPVAFEHGASMIDAMKADGPRLAAETILADALYHLLEQRRAALATTLPVAAAPGAAHPWADLLPLASRALAWSKTHNSAREQSYAILCAEAMVYSGDRKSIGTLGPLVGTSIDRADSALYVRFRFALARAQRLAGDDAKAFATLRAVAELLEGAPGAKTRDPAFWGAWAEMLRILESMNTDGSRSADIRVQIKRLELLDPTFGGPPNAETIRQVRSSVQ